MASYPQGYDEERFAITVSQNFLCLICFNVLKDPVECPRNQHCFCRACITKHLENSQRCPTCADELTVVTLTEPHRMVKDYLNELNIHCKHVNRGCHEIVQLQHLERHEATCGFTPVVCTNQGCAVTVNKRDQIHHESELCEFRKLKCHSCGEMTKTLTDMEKRMANVEKNVATMEIKLRNMMTRTDMEKVESNTATNMENMKKKIQSDIADIKTDMEGKLDAVNNEVKGLKTALIEGFNEMKEVLVKMEDKKEKNTAKVRQAASGDKEKENIIVAGGAFTDSVEIFNWHKKLWTPLKSMPDQRFAATSFVYNKHVTVAGGYSDGPDYVDNMIRMNIDPNPGRFTHWSGCPAKLPAKVAGHNSVVYKDVLIVTGGENKNGTSDCIDEVQLVPPYTVKTLSRMPEPRQDHSTQIFDDKLLIVGGSTTDDHKNNLSSVVLYDIKKMNANS